MVSDGRAFFIPLATLGIIGLVLAAFWPWAAVPGVIIALLACFVAFFFRDPEREVPLEQGIIVSPADGKVTLVKDTPGEDRARLVSIFLSIFDVHVNRAPMAGKITGLDYRRGAFLVAMDHRASIENEQNVVTIKNGEVTLVFKQIAGLIARRIVFWKQLGAEVGRGERVGLIKFGSRVDILFPANVEITVKTGDRVKGGVTVIGRIKP
jgi:phosphatidylserine decarboxylase